MNWKFWQREEPIKPGDMVVIVRDCCGTYLGRMFIVGDIFTAPSIGCGYCNYSDKNAPACRVTQYSGQMFYMKMAWLKKIRPLKNGEHDENYAERPVKRRVPA